ncbi:MAG: glycerol-3-phosphate dehydrogenase/oxidase [Chloroflexi bacterium]|nr:glycerol-3-phosphate dehydrogenase/oxidase [Chloroflexota bacterium]MBP7042858.1 glycerol-3-phosphate dehydrogenase/oxidase [Chloroflexota bacterium]
MWMGNWREEVWREVERPYDILIVGGGITGAGILREAARLGLRALLVEQKDFAWGTSSRSSKLVHGGLRYLKEGKIGLTRASVSEREHLLEEGPGLIDPLGFLLATYKSDKTGRLVFRAGLTVYDLLALQWSHRYYSPRDFQMLAPHLTAAGLKGGFRYGDAQTDDARLVLRVIAEAVADGATAVNYVLAEQLLRDENGRVHGLILRDQLTNQTANVTARVVISATGAWADELRGQVGGEARIRPLRGSHLVFPNWRLPVAQAISFLHPIDQRPVMIFPWEGVTLVGTTDVDHARTLDKEPCISPDETAYLLAAVESQFPSLGITLGDVVAAFAGVRPVIGSGKEDPSDESRDHVVWVESGLLTVTGGKMTTFRLIALDALKEVRHLLPDLPELADNLPVLNPVNVALPGGELLPEEVRRRLLGRYGAAAPALVAAAQAGELDIIPGTQTLWAELRWAARAEAISHLDDLLLRRVRLGILLPEGGAALLPRIRAICQTELGWDDGRWQSEQAAYLALVRGCYSVPDAALIPDWRALLAKAKQADLAAAAEEGDGGRKRPLLLAVALALSLLILWRLTHPSRKKVSPT